MRSSTRGSRPDAGLAVCFLATAAVLSTLGWHFEPRRRANPVAGAPDVSILGGGRLLKSSGVTVTAAGLPEAGRDAGAGLPEAGRDAGAGTAAGLPEAGRDAGAGTAETPVSGLPGGRCDKEDPWFCKGFSHNECPSATRQGDELIPMRQACPGLCGRCSGSNVAVAPAPAPAPNSATSAVARTTATTALSPAALDVQFQPPVTNKTNKVGGRVVLEPKTTEPGELPKMTTPGRQAEARPPARSCETRAERSKLPNPDNWGDPGSPCFLRKRDVTLSPE